MIGLGGYGIRRNWGGKPQKCLGTRLLARRYPTSNPTSNPVAGLLRGLAWGISLSLLLWVGLGLVAMVTLP